MIVRRIGGELWLFEQLNHSRICGDMATAWGAEPFVEVPPEVRRAAEIHDSGWPEWDQRPRLNPGTGYPHPYSDMPDNDYLAIWERGLARGWEEGELVGLLVSLHGMRFFGHKQRPADRTLLRRQRALQRNAVRTLSGGVPDADRLPEPYATWHAWMFFWDGLSLFLCEGWDSPWSTKIPVAGGGGPVEMRVERAAQAQTGGTFILEPFPFRGELALQVPARVIPARKYAAQAQLDAAIETADQRFTHWTAHTSR
jgi:hypothetical protein